MYNNIVGDNVDWNDAIDDAKLNVAIYCNNYITNWDDVVEEAKQILKEKREEEYDDACTEISHEHREYLKTTRWQNIRLRVLFRDNYTCKDCGATKNLNVHHLTYDSKGTNNEIIDCIVICKSCHKNRHS